MEATRTLMKAANALRRQMTLPEVLLWQRLRRSPSGVKFRRQYAIGPYVADFYCPSAKMVIEVDGRTHEFTSERDATRDQLIASYGVSIQRIAAEDVLKDAAGVASAIVQLCRAGPLHHSPRMGSGSNGPPPHGCAAGRTQ